MNRRPTVVERSRALTSRSWMRKVVGSNPGETYIGISFSFVEIDFDSIAKRRLLRGNELERQQCKCDETEPRGRSNQPSSSGAIYQYCNILT